MSEWRTVFIIMICVLTLTGAIFQLFGTGKRTIFLKILFPTSVCNFL